MRGHNYVPHMLHTSKHTHRFPRAQVHHKFTHSHSTMLLSHSPWSHFSQSPRVCEGQSGLSSHKPRLHTWLPVKVCVSTECYTARRNSKGKMERTQMTWNTMWYRTLSHCLWKQLLNFIGDYYLAWDYNCISIIENVFLQRRELGCSTQNTAFQLYGLK